MLRYTYIVCLVKLGIEHFLVAYNYSGLKYRRQGLSGWYVYSVMGKSQVQLFC